MSSMNNRCQEPDCVWWLRNQKKLQDSSGMRPAPEIVAGSEQSSQIIHSSQCSSLTIAFTELTFLHRGRDPNKTIRCNKRTTFGFARSQMSERGKEKLGASRGPCRVFSFFRTSLQRHNPDNCQGPSSLLSRYVRFSNHLRVSVNRNTNRMSSSGIKVDGRRQWRQMTRMVVSGDKWPRWSGMT